MFVVISGKILTAISSDHVHEVLETCFINIVTPVLPLFKVYPNNECIG